MESLSGRFHKSSGIREPIRFTLNASREELSGADLTNDCLAELSTLAIAALIDRPHATDEAGGRG